MNDPEKIVNWFFANKMLNFGPIFKPFEVLFAKLSDKTHHMCNFYVNQEKINNLSYGLLGFNLSLSLASFATSSDSLFFRDRSSLKDHCAVRICRTKKLHIWRVLSDNSAYSI